MKNYKSLVKFMAFGAAATFLLTSCSMEDNMNKHFNEIESNISNIIVKVDTNATALEEQSEILTDIKTTIESHEKSFEEVKNEQIGLLLRRYFDSCARQPEATEMLNKAKDTLLEGFSKISTTGKAYGLGSIAGANSSVAELYSGIAGDGIFDCIARQPDISEASLSLEVYIIDKIESTSNDLCCEMIGLSSTTVFDGMARVPENAKKLSDYEKYIVDAITNVKNEIDSISIGYASTSFFNSVARQPDIADDMWSVFKDFIDSLVL